MPSAGRVTKHTREEMNLECKTAKREAFTCIHRFQNIMNLSYNQNVLPPMGRAPTPDSTHDFFCLCFTEFLMRMNIMKFVYAGRNYLADKISI